MFVSRAKWRGSAASPLNFCAQASLARTGRSDNLLPMKTPRKSGKQQPARSFLDGQMLIAMPAMSDERFSRAVIYVCAHSSEGAMGIVVNQAAQNVKFPDLLVQLEVIPAAERIQLPTSAEAVM